VLAQAAWAASRCKKGYLRALFHRIKARRGWSKAIIAVAHKILVIAYTMLRDGTTYQDVGDDYFDKLNPLRTTRRLVHRLERLGFHVDLSKPDQLST
jgi:transposase